MREERKWKAPDDPGSVTGRPRPELPWFGESGALRQVLTGCRRKVRKPPVIHDQRKKCLRARMSASNTKDECEFIFWFETRHRASCGFYGWHEAGSPPDYPGIVTGAHWPERLSRERSAPCAKLKRDAGRKEAESQDRRPITNGQGKSRLRASLSVLNAKDDL